MSGAPADAMPRPGPAKEAPLSWVREVIEGNYRRLDQEARRLGERLGGEVARAQVRAMFGAVRRLAGLRGDERARELAMLRPRIAHAAARAEGLDPLREALAEASRIVEEQPDQRTRHLVDLLEAVLCYAAEGRPRFREAPRPKEQARAGAGAGAGTGAGTGAAAGTGTGAGAGAAAGTGAGTAAGAGTGEPRTGAKDRPPRERHARGPRPAGEAAPEAAPPEGAPAEEAAPAEDSESSNVQGSEGRPTEAQSTEAQSTEAQSTEAQSTEAQSTEAQSSEETRS